MKNIDILRQIELFSSLSENELETLATLASLHHFAENETLFTKGDLCHNILILTDGVVSVFKHDSKGNEVVIGYFHRNALLAEAATLRRTPLPSSARFHTNGSILKIDIESFDSFLMNNPKFAYKIIESLLEKIELLQQNIHFNLASTTKERVLNFYQQNPKLTHDLKQYEIASLLGMRPETLTRVSKQLVGEELLLKTTFGYKANKDQ